jgi:phosphoserine aminotransferase
MSLRDLRIAKEKQGIHNFSAGPCILPNEVMEKAAESVVNLDGIGLSILEISHRSKEFVEIIERARSLVRETMNLPDNYEVLFLQGGASYLSILTAQNFLSKAGTGAYVNSGTWARNSMNDAKVFGNIIEFSTSENTQFNTYPKLDNIPSDLDYIHITSNNTIAGNQIKDFPKTDVPLICDMSSDIFSRDIDVSQFAMIYAGAQKNLGPAGATLVIVDKNKLGQTDREIPRLMDLRNHIEKMSMLNTPPCFSIYVSLLNLEWMIKNGGVEEMKKRSIDRSSLLYKEIDENPLFDAHVKDLDSRSKMNICFTLKDESMNEDFLAACEKANISGIKGHRSVGGFRASMYNAMSIDSTMALVKVMKTFKS